MYGCCARLPATAQVIADTFFDLKLIPKKNDVREAGPAALT